MNLSDMQGMISDLTGIEPRSIGSDAEAADAAQWVALIKNTEAEVEAALDPAIKEAFAAHKKLTGEKKGLLEKLTAATGRVRANLANWIAGGHDVKGCYIKTTFKVIVEDINQIPDDYIIPTVDEKALLDWARTTEGSVPVPGVRFDPVHVLYAREV